MNLLRKAILYPILFVIPLVFLTACPGEQKHSTEPAAESHMEQPGMEGMEGMEGVDSLEEMKGAENMDHME